MRDLGTREEIRLLEIARTRDLTYRDYALANDGRGINALTRLLTLGYVALVTSVDLPEYTITIQGMKWLKENQA